MQLSKKRLIRNTAIVAALILFSYCLMFILHPLAGNSLAGSAFMTLRWVIHITLTVYWCDSIHRRILITSIRRMLMSVGVLLLFWQLIRIIKYDYVIVTESICRYLWYGYYIPMVLVPLIGVFVIDHIGKPEGYASPGWMKYLFVPAALLILLVFTNDLHQTVFTFNEGFYNFNTDYGYGFFYPFMMAWFALLGLYFVIMLLKKSRVPGSRRFQKTPLFVMLGAIVFWTGYSLRLYSGDMTAVNSLMIILLLESAIQTGLIPSNMNYYELFKRASVSVEIIDNENRSCYLSGGAGEHLHNDLIERAKLRPVELQNTVLHSQSIQGGYVLWQNDVAEIKKLATHLMETNELLEERYDLKKAEVELRERRIRAEEKSRLYDRIAREVSGKLDKADALMKLMKEKPEKTNLMLAQICVISAYIKRRANLILISEEKETVQASEIESCIRESLDNLKLTGVIAYADMECEGRIGIREIIHVYDFFEETVEQLLDRVNAVMVTVRRKGEEMFIRIQAGLKEELSAFQAPLLTGGSVKTELQEEDILIEGTLKAGREEK